MNSDLLQYVRSYVKGRIRIRHPQLKGLTADEIESLVAAATLVEGVKSLEVNPRVGSLLLYWDDSVVSLETLLQMAQWWLPTAMPADASTDESATATPTCACTTSLTKKARSLCVDGVAYATRASQCVTQRLTRWIAFDVTKGNRAKRVTQNRVMLATYVAMLAALAFRATKVHVALGIVYTGMLGVHLYQHRKVL